ncbi:hypothetical protein CDCA_CDCA03G1150 [Cyanidium caldarium]|uniref:Membrane-associated protein n=1 Tax=Cyanidium caldarium TaxID=2771 RepID=A0AAV9ISP3_CYACA|nr:hypothetical protein CDCA_CDCA03G1150 [Cyanidium caldarium]
MCSSRLALYLLLAILAAVVAVQRAPLATTATPLLRQVKHPPQVHRQATSAPALVSALVTNEHTLPIEVIVEFGKFVAAASASERQVSSKSVVFPGDTVVLGTQAVQLREASVVMSLSTETSSSTSSSSVLPSGPCVQRTLAIQTVTACGFPSNDTSVPYTYPGSCATLTTPYATENEEDGVFVVSTNGGSSSSPPVRMRYAGGVRNTAPLVVDGCSL